MKNLNKKIMKNFKKLCLLTLIVLTGFSCGNDDDNSLSITEQNRANIIGTWKLTSETENGIDIDLEDCELLLTLIFNTTQINVTDFCDPPEPIAYDYTIDENTLDIIEEGEIITYEITTLNDTILTISEVDDGFIYTETYTKQ
jgi:hypothetical protein